MRGAGIRNRNIPSFMLAVTRRYHGFLAVVLITLLNTTPATPAAIRLDSADRAIVVADQRHAAGFEELRVPYGNEPPLIAGVWYPTTGEPRDVSLESFTQNVVPAGAIKGRALPLIILSHGGGGSYAGHYDTALALARAGFVVAAVSHAGDTYDDQSKVMMLWRRPEQLSRLIDYMLTGWRGHTNLDPRRIGAFGFSNGGFTVLVEAGGVPDLMKIDPYCAANPTHDLCTALAQAGVHSVSMLHPPADAWRPDRRIRAVAAAAPAFGFTFDRAGLASVHIPVLLWRAEGDQHQPSPWYEEHVKAALPQTPTYLVEPLAGHYAFLPPCTAHLREVAPAICVDGPGFDRAEFHRRMNAELIRFFRTALH